MVYNHITCHGPHSRNYNSLSAAMILKFDSMDNKNRAKSSLFLREYSRETRDFNKNKGGENYKSKNKINKTKYISSCIIFKKTFHLSSTQLQCFIKSIQKCLSNFYQIDKINGNVKIKCFKTLSTVHIQTEIIIGSNKISSKDF